jgi:hypothetical protein
MEGLGVMLPRPAQLTGVVARFCCFVISGKTSDKGDSNFETNTRVRFITRTCAQRMFN